MYTIDLFIINYMQNCVLVCMRACVYLFVVCGCLRATVVVLVTVSWHRARQFCFKISAHL